MKHFARYRAYLYHRLKEKNVSFSSKQSVAAFVSMSLMKYSSPQIISSTTKVYEQFLHQFGA